MKNTLFVLIIIFAILAVSCKKEESHTHIAYIQSEIDSLDTKDKIEAFTRTAHIPSKIDSLDTEDEIEDYGRNTWLKNPISTDDGTAVLSGLETRKRTKRHPYAAT